VTRSVIRFINLISLMLLVAHWNGCMQYLVPVLNDFPDDSWVTIHGLRVSLVFGHAVVRTYLNPLFQSEAKCKAIDLKIIFYAHSNKNHFHNKGFTLILVLRVRVFGTRN